MKIRDEGADSYTLTLSDEEASIVAPIILEWHKSGKLVRSQKLLLNEPLKLVRQDDEYLVIDPGGFHPSLQRFLDNHDLLAQVVWGSLDSLRVPTTTEALDDWLARSGEDHYNTLQAAIPTALPPNQLQQFFDKLASEDARSVVVAGVCKKINGESDTKIIADWKAAAQSLLTGVSDDPRFYELYLAYFCNSGALPFELIFTRDWESLKNGLEKPDLSYSRARFLAEVSINPKLALETWGQAARRGYNMAIRAEASHALTVSFPRAATPDLPSWRELLNDLVQNSIVPRVNFDALYVLYHLSAGTMTETNASLDAVRILLGRSQTKQSHFNGVCTARKLTSGANSVLWPDFVTKLNLDVLEKGAREAIDDPSKCD